MSIKNASLIIYSRNCNCNRHNTIVHMFNPHERVGSQPNEIVIKSVN